MAKVYAERMDLSLTEEMIDAVVEIVRAGNFRYIAFQQIGVTQWTFQKWLSRGTLELKRLAEGELDEDQLTLKAHLVRRLGQAEAECHRALLRDVLAVDDPRIKLEFLSRRYKKLYTKQLAGMAHDDETGEDVKREGAAILAEKLARFLDDD
jgi:hypothetical protein